MLAAALENSDSSLDGTTEPCSRRRWPLTMSVPKSMQRMVTVPSGSGMFAIINIRKGVISGMLLVRV